MYLCSFKDGFIVLDYIQGGRAVSTFCEPHMLETELTSSPECNNTTRFESISMRVSAKLILLSMTISDVVFGIVFIYVFVAYFHLESYFVRQLVLYSSY